MDDNELAEVLNEFITESNESLDLLDQELVALEKNPDPDVIARIFRSIHTVKGTSGFLGFVTLESITHVGENLLAKLRNGEQTVTTATTTALLSLVDAVREILAIVAETGAEGDETYDDLRQELQHLVDGEVPARAELRIIARNPDAESDDDAGAVVETEAIAAEPSPRIGEQFLREGLISEEQLEQALARQDAGDPRHVGELLVENNAVSPSEVVEALKAQGDERPTGGESIRVDVQLLDDLMNLVGELVLARNQILQFTQEKSDVALVATSQRLNLITTELQEGVMKTRMQPIENVWNKFPRVVRDLTVACGKRARLEMEGRQTEVDKTLLEAIKDPLTHLIRNAIDHGLETPEARVAAGKPAEGVIRLSAYHEGGLVIVEICDDGAGIDPQALRRKAVQKGLLTNEEAAARSDREIIGIIFQAGFSTAEAVTNISGRGVGMDVVKTNIEAIGGSVDVQSVVGVGTTFKVKIPLTLAIIPALVVTCGGERYAIPQVSLIELVRLDDQNGENGVEWVQGAPVHRLRGRLLPLVFLDQVFGAAPSSQPGAVNIVVLQADDSQFGLVIDDISDTAEIVVKPLGRLLKNAAGFAGATIMGDGRVALILDVLGLAQHAGMSSSGSRSRQEQVAAIDDRSSSDSESILIVGLGERRFALPLATVARLEEIPEAAVRWAGDQQVVHYRGQILPLVRLTDKLGIPSGPSADGNLQVLVCGSDERSIGLIVDTIYDIVEDRLDISERTTTFGVMGTVVLNNEVTDVLDLSVIVGDDVILTVLVDEEAAA